MNNKMGLIAKPTFKINGKWMTFEIKQTKELVLDEDFICLGFTHTFPSNSSNRFHLTFNGNTPFTLRGQNVNTNYVPFRIFWGGADYPNYFAVPYYLPKGTSIFLTLSTADTETSHQFQLFGYYTSFGKEINLAQLPIPRIIVNEMVLKAKQDDSDVSVVALERTNDFVIDNIVSYALWDTDFYLKFGILWGIGSYTLEVKVDGSGEFMNKPVNIHGFAGSIQHPRKINPQIKISRGSSITSLISWLAADSASSSYVAGTDISHWLIYGGYDIKMDGGRNDKL